VNVDPDADDRILSTREAVTGSSVDIFIAALPLSRKQNAAPARRRNERSVSMTTRSLDVVTRGYEQTQR
jgi:hypothetical protein